MLSLKCGRDKQTPTGKTNKMKTPKIQLSDFSFIFQGRGHYSVTYTSPTTRKEYKTTTSDMPLIDATKNADTPKLKDLVRLKNICKY